MAEFTYDSRKKITEKWIAKIKGEAKDLSDMERKLLPSPYRYNLPQTEAEWIEKQLESGKYLTLSELYRREFPHLVAACVPKGMEETFYYALDQMNQYQMTAGWWRRSMRSKSYVPFVRNSILLLWACSRLKFYRFSLGQILTGNMDKGINDSGYQLHAEEIYDHARTEYWDYACLLAAQMDCGNQETIQAVKDILLGEGNTAMISHELIRGIVMSKNEDLYKLLGDFLLAARLQEGARQAVCETMDAGRPEAFLHLFKVIEDNNLVRYSSIKRAVSTWIGIFNEKSVDRITDKLVRLMGQCLRDKGVCEEQLLTEDAVAISCALWAKGFYDAKAAVEAVKKLAKEGSRHQIMTASYFVGSIQDKKLSLEISKEVIRKYSDDLELDACYMFGLIYFPGGCFRDLLTYGSSYYPSDKKVVEPKALEPENYFDSGEEAEEFYHYLQAILNRLPKKGLTIDPCIFPWHQVTLNRSDVVSRMALIAWMLQKEEYLNEVISLIPQMDSTFRHWVVRIFLYRPKRQEQKDVLFELLHNPESYTMEAAFQLVNDLELKDEDYGKIEKNLKYKTGRKETLKLLRRQSIGGQKASISRLIQTNSEDCHMGALDMALSIKQKSPEAFSDIPPILAELKNPTSKVQVLLDELTGESSKAQDIVNTPGYGLYDPKKEWVIPPANADTEEVLNLFTPFSEEHCIEILEHLNALIEKNKDREYTSAWDTEMVLGTQLARVRHRRADAEFEPLDEYPFRELWEEFYQKEIRTPQMMMVLYLYQICRGNENYYKKNLSFYAEMFGQEKKGGLFQKKKPPFENLITGLRYGSQARQLIDTMFEQYVPSALCVKWGIAGTARFLSLLNEENALFKTEETRWKETYPITVRRLHLPIIQQMFNWLSQADEDHWETAFSLRFQLQLAYDQWKDKELRPRYGGYQAPYVRLRDFVCCWERGIWDKSLVYKAVFRFLNLGAVLGPVSAVEKKGLLHYRDAEISSVNAFFGNHAIEPVDGKYRYDNLTEETLPAIKLAREIYREAVPMVLQVELKRGEQNTPFSSSISSINVIYGIDYLVAIMTALGKDSFQRGYAYGSSQSERKGVLSHLLQVCHPKPEETAADLKKALKGSDISKKRLAELAMYAPQWIPMLAEYLKLPGLQSGCYYFKAHTNEGFDEYTTSIIAKYTPLTPEELQGGAFDINWFFEAYKQLGEANFKLLYDAAKYSSSGTAHGRARKYADAALGKVGKEALKEEIQAKRNKDLLMSVGLLPFAKGKKKEEEDILDRYQFIQQFKKESTKFGAQRRASEGKAVDLALQNLSVHAGYTDVTRLTLRMESKLAESFADSYEWKKVDGAEEVELKLSVDETGKSSLLCRKGDKQLKSIPAKIKKNEQVLLYQERNKKLREQYRRTRQMMEQAMEDRTKFEVWELLELMKNPVVRPILAPLVLMTEKEPVRFGFLSKEGLTDWSGTVLEVKPTEQVFIAHPYDLYQDGHWQDYQKYLFEHQMKQPFKQVFRELYVKLEEEQEKDKSLMFAGNQIQPQKTVATLRSRRWVADYEDGLQKVYYKENIIARIYAMADWFSPSDIEAPTLEYVVFYHRKTFEAMKLKEIPDVIYSEVMRDVDLAVSVAHAGGVDPETSHSTIEMRQMIVQCNLELFKVKNVKVEKNHAVIEGSLGKYTVHLGSGVVHQMGNTMLNIVPVHSQHRGRMFLPFVDDDPKTAEIMSKILLLAEDKKIKDPSILAQIR